MLFNELDPKAFRGEMPIVIGIRMTFRVKKPLVCILCNIITRSRAKRANVCEAKLPDFVELALNERVKISFSVENRIIENGYSENDGVIMRS